MNKTGIEYLDFTWNPIAMRCNRVSSGCDNCWHLRMAKRHAKNYAIGSLLRTARAGGDFALLDKELVSPLRRKKPAVISVQFMGDLFHGSVPDEWIDAVFVTMAEAARHTFLILTKRIDRASDWYGNVRSRRPQLGWGWCTGGPPFASTAYPFDADVGYCGTPWPLPNVWLGVSVEDQAAADERVPQLLAIDAAVRWVSYEPAIGPLDLSEYLEYFDHGITGPTEIDQSCPGLDWVVAGAETGAGARPAENVWFREVLDDCVAAGVPYFFKRDSYGNETLDGELHREFPR